MRIVMIGASETAIMTANLLLKKGHELLIIEMNKNKIEKLNDVLDCVFIEGDGTNPTILQEIDPKSADYLFCLTNSDQNNIIASLVGKSLGLKALSPRLKDRNTKIYVVN